MLMPPDEMQYALTCGELLRGLKLSEGPKGGWRKGGRGRKLSHFSFCCACFPVWGEEKVMTIYDAGPLAAGPLCGLLKLVQHAGASVDEGSGPSPQPIACTHGS